MRDYPETWVQAMPSLAMRPRPSFDTERDVSVLLGGKPQLPSHLEWPEGLSFYAQINLSKVPASFYANEKQWHLDLPTSGTLFIFLPLEDPYNAPAKVLYCEEDVSHQPEREPVDSAPDLRAGESKWCSYWVDTVGLSECGRLLYRQRADLLPFLSAYSVNGLWANMEEAANNPAYVAQNRAAQALEKATLAAAYKANPLPPPRDKSPVSSGFGNWKGRSSEPLTHLKHATLTWAFIFDYARHVEIESLSLAQGYVNRLLGDDHFSAKHRDRLERKKDSFWKRNIEARNKAFQPSTKVSLKSKFRRVQALRQATKKRRFDDRALAWMEVARLHSGLVPADISKQFLCFIEEIQTYKDPSRKKLNLRALDSWIRETQLGDRDVRLIGETAIRASQHHLVIETLPKDKVTGALPHEVLRLTRDAELADRYWDERLRLEVAPGTSSGPHNFSIGSQHTQMLGAPFAVQPQVDSLAQENVMLLQIASEAGMQINPPDGNFQLWIDPADLQNRRFEKAKFTYFFS
ncbi:MAG: DUF1963 domain-containing protein [Pseudomonadota bacterium]